jgi:hypothetical protein
VQFGIAEAALAAGAVVGALVLAGLRPDLAERSRSPSCRRSCSAPAPGFTICTLPLSEALVAPAGARSTVASSPGPSVALPAYGSGGVEIDRDGLVWQNWRGSGHFASFDRRKCKVTHGPTATGQSCPEGWTFYRRSNPTYQNSTINSDESYLTQIDFHDVLGLGRDVPLYGAVNTDSLEVLVPKTKQFVTLRVPYPMGFFSRSATGRIDDPSAGWKGKGLWSAFSSYAAWHVEGGKGTKQKIVKFQIRPDPLAK